MDRGCITYSIAYIMGILLAQPFSTGLPYCTAILFLLLILSFSTKNNTRIFLLVSHLAIFCAGAGAYSLAKGNKDLPPDKFTSTIKEKAESAQEKVSAHLRRYAGDENSHSVLCALTVGNKDNMDKGLKEAYSCAGAMHILALSGLHVGIIYSIVEKVLVPLSIFPAGRYIRTGISLMLLLCYSILSGCSPSVMRACTMIFIYKIAASSFRHTDKWDALGLSALTLGVFSPLQVCSIGFQLSYAAVIGIGAMYPICHKAFMQICKPGRILQGTLYRITLAIWDSISISVCCQMAVLPLIIIHFGESAQYFIITNLIAIPLASIILHIFVFTVALQWIPPINDILTYCLNFCLELLNGAILFISN